MILSGGTPAGSAYLAINCNGINVAKVTLSKAITPSTVFKVWGSLRATSAGGEVNNFFLGYVAGSSGAAVPPSPVFQLGWDVLIFQRFLGADVGTIEVEGAAWGRVAPIERALPTVVGTYSTALDYGTAGETFAQQLDDAATPADSYLLAGTNDSTAGGGTGFAGCTPLLGGLPLVGGGANPPIIVTGYRYVVAQCVAHGAATQLVGVQILNAGSDASALPAGGASIPSAPLTLMERDASAIAYAAEYDGPAAAPAVLRGPTGVLVASTAGDVDINSAGDMVILAPAGVGIGVDPPLATLHTVGVAAANVQVGTFEAAATSGVGFSINNNDATSNSAVVRVGNSVAGRGWKFVVDSGASGGLDAQLVNRTTHGGLFFDGLTRCALGFTAPLLGTWLDLSQGTIGGLALPGLTGAQETTLAAVTPVVPVWIYNTTLQIGRTWNPVRVIMENTVPTPTIAAFGADVSILTATNQNIPPSGPLTTGIARGVLMSGSGTLSTLRVKFTGNAANVGGQTVDFQVKQSVAGGAPGNVGTAITSKATNSGTSTPFTVQFAPVNYAIGDEFFVTVTPTAPLTTGLSPVEAVLS